jgi:hypothetical protein
MQTPLEAHRPSYTSPARLVIAIGVLHNTVGVVLGWKPLAEILRGGYIGAAEQTPDRSIVFWFFFFGFAVILFGYALRALERHALESASLGFGFGALCLAGGLAIPISGFWLGLVPAAMMVVRARRAATRVTERAATASREAPQASVSVSSSS